MRKEKSNKENKKRKREDEKKDCQTFGACTSPPCCSFFTVCRMLRYNVGDPDLELEWLLLGIYTRIILSFHPQGTNNLPKFKRNGIPTSGESHLSPMPLPLPLMHTQSRLFLNIIYIIVIHRSAHFTFYFVKCASTWV